MKARLYELQNKEPMTVAAARAPPPPPPPSPSAARLHGIGPSLPAGRSAHTGVDLVSYVQSEYGARFENRAAVSAFLALPQASKLLANILYGYEAALPLPF